MSLIQTIGRFRRAWAIVRNERIVLKMIWNLNDIFLSLRFNETKKQNYLSASSSKINVSIVKEREIDLSKDITKSNRGRNSFHYTIGLSTLSISPLFFLLITWSDTPDWNGRATTEQNFLTDSELLKWMSEKRDIRVEIEYMVRWKYQQINLFRNCRFFQ